MNFSNSNKKLHSNISYYGSMSKFFLVALGALVLNILPLPSVIEMYRPNFILLLVLYIQCCMPIYFRITWVFLLGIFLDVLSVSIIGQHSLALIVTCWAATTRPNNFKYYSMLQQMSVIFLYCLLYYLIILFTDLFFAINVNVYKSISLAFFSVVFWPILRILFTTPLESRAC